MNIPNNKIIKTTWGKETSFFQKEKEKQIVMSEIQATKKRVLRQNKFIKMENGFYKIVDQVGNNQKTEIFFLEGFLLWFTINS